MPAATAAEPRRTEGTSSAQGLPAGALFSPTWPANCSSRYRRAPSRCTRAGLTADRSANCAPMRRLPIIRVESQRSSASWPSSSPFRLAVDLGPPQHGQPPLTAEELDPFSPKDCQSGGTHPVSAMCFSLLQAWRTVSFSQFGCADERRIFAACVNPVEEWALWIRPVGPHGKFLWRSAPFGKIWTQDLTN